MTTDEAPGPHDFEGLTVQLNALRRRVEVLDRQLQSLAQTASPFCEHLPAGAAPPSTGAHREPAARTPSFPLRLELVRELAYRYSQRRARRQNGPQSDWIDAEADLALVLDRLGLPKPEP